AESRQGRGRTAARRGAGIGRRRPHPSRRADAGALAAQRARRSVTVRQRRHAHGAPRRQRNPAAECEVMGIEQSWHYLCILLVWKLAGQDELVVAVEDAERLVAAFPSPEAPP